MEPEQPRESGPAGGGTLPDRGGSCAAAVLVSVAGFGLLTLLAWLRYRANNYSIDLGNFLQAFHRSLDGAWMTGTVDGGEVNAPRWESHTEFILAPLVPVFALAPGAMTLLAAQAAAIAAGGWAVFVLARSRWGENRQALLALACYWAFPFLFHLSFSGFHADPFLIAPFLLAWHFHSKDDREDRPGPFWAMIVIGASVKEYACVFVFLLGAIIAPERKRRALALFAAALGQFLVVTPLANRLFRDAGMRLNFEGHILRTGEAGAGLWHTFLANISDSHYLAKTAAVTALFAWSWFRWPRGLILVAPLYLALTLLSTDSIFIHHHFAMLLPALFITWVEALRSMQPALRKRYLVFGMLASSLLFLFGHPDSQVSTELRETLVHPAYRNLFHYRATPHDRLADSLLAAVPGSHALATEHNLRPKAADREWAFIHPHPRDSLRADRYLFDFFETLELAPVRGSHEDGGRDRNAGSGGNGTRYSGEDGYGPEGRSTRRKRCAGLLRSRDFSLDFFEDGLVAFSRVESRAESGVRSPGASFKPSREPISPKSLSDRDFSWIRIEDGNGTDNTNESTGAGAGTTFAPGGNVPVTVRAEVESRGELYLLTADYHGRFGPAEAVISVFRRSRGKSGDGSPEGGFREDSLRVLHLPGYVLASLSGLPEGRYRETLAFRGPPGLLDGTWAWEMRFIRGHAHFPLTGRADLVLERRSPVQGPAGWPAGPQAW